MVDNIVSAAADQEGRRILAFLDKFSKSYQKDQFSRLSNAQAGLILNLLDSVSLAIFIKSENRSVS